MIRNLSSEVFCFCNGANDALRRANEAKEDFFLFRRFQGYSDIFREAAAEIFDFDVNEFAIAQQGAYEYVSSSSPLNPIRHPHLCEAAKLLSYAANRFESDGRVSELAPLSGPY